ncbi:hypothetical protein PACTADRAFT_47628 [Pachysolen tannophilus NRRL Y-2460]|uniref:Uncharacterized protein n=1 Tax=Pachysolen tannophilus NRRL Y-2460 TaxID=669874 RepID=A0A1E4U195_PACTA|nr:hypothetical protein PACTADRAFT_47628 [Pachysolen tannophilus NRRL Y-2460]
MIAYAPPPRVRCDYTHMYNHYKTNNEESIFNTGKNVLSKREKLEREIFDKSIEDIERIFNFKINGNFINNYLLTNNEIENENENENHYKRKRIETVEERIERNNILPVDLKQRKLGKINKNFNNGSYETLSSTTRQNQQNQQKIFTNNKEDDGNYYGDLTMTSAGNSNSQSWSGKVDISAAAENSEMVNTTTITTTTATTTTKTATITKAKTKPKIKTKPISSSSSSSNNSKYLYLQDFNFFKNDLECEKTELQSDIETVHEVYHNLINIQNEKDYRNYKNSFQFTIREPIDEAFI